MIVLNAYTVRLFVIVSIRWTASLTRPAIEPPAWIPAHVVPASPRVWGNRNWSIDLTLVIGTSPRVRGETVFNALDPGGDRLSDRTRGICVYGDIGAPIFGRLHRGSNLCFGVLGRFYRIMR
jgi:hypothetical protein